MRCNNVQFYTAAVDAPPNSLAGLGASTAGRCSDGKQSVASVLLPHTPCSRACPGGGRQTRRPLSRRGPSGSCSPVTWCLFSHPSRTWPGSLHEETQGGRHSLARLRRADPTRDSRGWRGGERGGVRVGKYKTVGEKSQRKLDGHKSRFIKGGS